MNHQQAQVIADSYKAVGLGMLRGTMSNMDLARWHALCDNNAVWQRVADTLKETPNVP